MSKVTVRRTLVLAGAAAALTTLMSAPASAESAPSAPSGAATGATAEVGSAGTTYWRLRFVVKGKSRCVDVPRASKRMGVKLQLWDCHKKSNQQWAIRASSGPEQIFNRNSRLCLNVAGGSTKSGAPIIQWECSWNYGNGLWNLKYHNKAYKIVNARSGQCLTVNGSSTKNGASLIQWPCRSNLDSQRVHLTR